MRKIFSIFIVVVAANAALSAQTTSSRRHHAPAASITTKVDAKATEAANGISFPHTAFSYPLEDFRPGVVRVGPRTTYLKEGLRIDEVVRLLGKPLSVSERNEQKTIIKTYVFQRGEGQVLIAEFENGLLARSRTELRDQLLQADRL
ncbi:MAG TPA: hypothetical protein VIW64_14420 [Pyrinomonadaceae bacterium]